MPESFRINDVAFEMAQRGHDVTVLTSIPDYPQGKFYDGYSLFKKRREEINGVTVIRVPVIPKGNGKKFRMILNYMSAIFFFTFYGLWEALTNRFECVFIHDTSPAFIAIPALIVKKIQKIPMHLWILDMWPESLIAGGIRNKKVYSAVERMMSIFYRNSTKILISSSGFRKMLTDKGVKNEKIVYLPNWCDEAVTQRSQCEIPQLPEGFKVMFAGNYGEAQNLDNVMKAARLTKDNKDIHWIFIGDGRKKRWADQYVADNGLADTVHQYGRFPIETMSSFFEKADVMLLPLRNQLVFNMTLPAKIQAYMAIGKPIMGIINGEGADVIRKSSCGWCVDADDYEGLAQKIKTISSLPREELDKLGSNGYEYYKQNFTKDKCVGRIERIICGEDIQNAI